MVGNAKEQRLLLQCTLAVVDEVKGDFMLHTIHAPALSALLPCGIQEYLLMMMMGNYILLRAFMVCWGNAMDEAKKGLEVRSWSRTMIFCEEAFTVGVLMPLFVISWYKIHFLRWPCVETLFPWMFPAVYFTKQGNLHANQPKNNSFTMADEPNFHPICSGCTT